MRAIGRAALRVVAVGAHPDDAESGCGGTLARYAESGATVTVIYLTRGELGIEGRPPDEVARTRTSEALEACAVLGAHAVFATQVNGQVEATPSRVAEVLRLLSAAAPDVLLAPWPLDTDPEHQVASLLATRAAMALHPSPRLFFYEVDTGTDTLGYAPTVYVDITAVRERKIQALRAHASQSFVNLYEKHDAKIEAFRGRAIGVKAAEAFAPFGERAATALPGL